MPFGLCNAPATFQRLMQNCLGELNMTICIVYLDDVIVFSKTIDQHIEDVRKVLECFRAHNLKLKPSKCKLFQKKLVYLGHEISADGINPSPENVRAIAQYPPPGNYTQVRRFLGMTGSYRKFVWDFAGDASPLHALTGGDGANKKLEPVELNKEQEISFELLKHHVMTAPTLAFPDYDREFLLETDASGVGLGAVLQQKGKDGKYHPIAFGSRLLTPSEKNYHSSKLEFLALKWAVVDHFKKYLGWRPFKVKTDNNPLTYIFTTENLDATGFRWVSALANYNFEIEYLRGRDNKVADALSRVEEHLDAETVKSILDGVTLPVHERAELHNSTLAKEEERVVEEVKAAAGRVQTGPRLPAGRPSKVDMHVTDWSEEQKKDPRLDAVIKWVKNKRDKNQQSRPLKEFLGDLAEGNEGQALLRQKDTFTLRKDILYRQCTLPEDQEKVDLFVVPKSHRMDALNRCHMDAGHQGIRRTLSLLKERFWWPGMATQMRKMIQDCRRCRIFGAAVQKAELEPISATSPLELIHLDFTSIETTMDPMVQPKTANVLVITDHFTRYCMAFVTPDQKAATVAKVLLEKFICVFGPPSRILSDQGKSFTGAVVQELCALMGVKQSRTTAYHPQTNGQVERANQTIFRMIGKLEENKKANWKDHLGEITFAYNATRSAVTGRSPYFLMFGRRPKLPVDFFFPTQRDNGAYCRVDGFVASVKERLTEALQEARRLTTAEAARSKRYYDRQASAPVLRPRDVVLVKADAKQGRRKILDRWNSDPWEVIGPLSDVLPVYKIKNDHGQVRTVHRNRLLLLAPAEERGVPVTLTAKQGMVSHTAGPDLLDEKTSTNEVEDRDRTSTKGVGKGDRPRVEEGGNLASGETLKDRSVKSFVERITALCGVNVRAPT